MDEPTIEQLRQTVRASRAGVLSFWLAVAAALVWASGVVMGLGDLLHRGHVDEHQWAWSMVLHLVAALLSGVGLRLALDALADKQRQVLTPWLGLALNGPLLVLAGVLLLVFGIDLVWQVLLR